MTFEYKRLDLGDRIAGGGAVLLFIFFMFFHWFSLHGAGQFGANGWDAFTVLRWLVLLTIILALAHVFLKATDQTIDLPVAPALIVACVGGFTTILILYRMFIDQPGPDKLVDLDFAAWLGLLSLIGIVVGAWLSMDGTAGMPTRSSSAPATAPPPAARPSAPAPAPTPPAPDPGPPPAATTPPPQPPDAPGQTTPTGS